MVILSEQQAGRVETAIAQAEATTSAEIVVCVLPSSTDDRGISAIAGAVVFAVVEFFGPRTLPGLDPLIWLGIAAIAAVTAFWLCDRLDLALRCLPSRLLIKDARRAARAMFLDHRLDDTAERNAVLLFISRAERYVEILPDRAAAAAIEPAQWTAIIDEFRAAMRTGVFDEAVAAAIARIGALCAAHFPPSRDNPDRVPNRPIQD